MSRLHLTAATLTLCLSLVTPSPAQDLPALDMSEPPLPQAGPPPPLAPEEPPPEIILLDHADIVGTWHGIDPNPGIFNAWEIHYRNNGTYQIRVFRREFDNPAEEGMDVEELTDGTWKITPNGCLEFDDGDMLFEPIARDNTKTVYTASFPGEMGAKPWTVHEFPGPAPAVIFKLAPFTAKANARGGPEDVQLSNLRHLLLGCSVYAVDNGGQFPARLSALEPHIGAETLEEMDKFTDPGTGKQIPWTILPGRTITDPHGTILMHSPEFGDGRRIVGLIDNTAMILEQEEFAAMMAQQKE